MIVRVAGLFRRRHQQRGDALVELARGRRRRGS
jgi:hypothetical protein